MGVFKHTTTDPEPQTLKNMSSLAALDAGSLAELSTAALSFLTSAESEPYNNAISAVAERNGAKLKAVKGAMESMVHFFFCCGKRSLTPAQVGEDLIEFGYEKEKSDTIVAAWTRNFLALSRSMIDQTLNINKLVDMEWKFGVTASSSDMQQVGSAFLQLKLVLESMLGEKGVHIELTLPQFYEFLKEMEKAKVALDNLV